MTDTSTPPTDAAPAPAGEARHDRHDRGRPRRLAELFALTGFAVVQPILDVTGRSPDFFLFRRPTTLHMWALLAIVVLAPPLGLWLAEVVAGLVSRTAERVLHLVFVAGLLTTIAVEVGKQGGFYGRYLAAVALVAGCALAVVVARVQRVRQALVYASPAPLVFVLIFALTTPAGALLRPAKAGPATGTSGAGKPPIVLLVFDEFPTRVLLDANGAVDRRLYPNIARLAATSTWYPNATGVSGWTPFAVPPILNGRFPRERVAPAYVEYPDNLFTLLGDAYDMNVHESISLLCPERYCKPADSGRATGLGALLDDTIDVAKEVVSPRRPPTREGEEFAEQADPDPPLPEPGELDVMFRVDEGKRNQPERMTQFLDGLGTRSDKPMLHFLHLLLPHVPFRYLPSGNTYADHPGTFPLGRVRPDDSFRRNLDPGTIAIFEQRLMLQAVYVDGLVGQLIDRMEQAGVWDDSLVVMTADHGTGFTPGEMARHLDKSNHADLAYVPLFVKQPRQTKGAVDERNAMNVDVLPTVTDVIDVRLPFPIDGVSLLGAPRPTLAKQWYDTPSRPLPIDGARWKDTVRRGVAPAIAQPARGPEGLFALGPLGGLVGKPLSSFTVGAPSPVVATARMRGGFDASPGHVPALVWGDLDRPVGPNSTWVVISVNGTIAGTALAAPNPVGGGKWHFVGMANDKPFKAGTNDVRLHAVTGTTLHQIGWSR